MAETISFRSARWKIERANEHVDELNRQITAYLSREPVHVYIEQDGPHKGAVGLHYKEAIPYGFTLLMGDVAHNLRAALDHTIWSMLSDKVGDSSHLQYPFPRKAMDDEAFDHALRSAQINLAGEKVFDVVKGLNGRANGDPVLWGIHSLDNIDKHRTVVMAVNQVNPAAIGDVWLYPFMTGHYIPFTPDSPNYPTPGAVAIDIDKAQAQLAPTICFAHGEPFARQNVIAALVGATDRVTYAVDKLTSAFAMKLT